MGRAPTPAATGIKHRAFPTNTVKTTRYPFDDGNRYFATRGWFFTGIELDSKLFDAIEYSAEGDASPKLDLGSEQGAIEPH